MKEDNFWGILRLSGANKGIIVRIFLALLVMIGSIALAWTLLGTHNNAHAVAQAEVSTGQEPWALAFDTNGHVWVSDPGCYPQPPCTPTSSTGEIDEFNQSDMTTVHQFLSKPSVYVPVFLVTDGSGNVWFTDSTNNAIGELVPGTSTWHEWKTGFASGGVPSDLTFDGAGNIWFTERGVNAIGFFNPNTLAFHENTIGTINDHPYGIVYDAVNNVVWFTDSGIPDLGNFTPTTNGVLGAGTVHLLPVSADPLHLPHLLTLDKNQNVWYSEGDSGYVGKLVHGSTTPTEYPVCAGPPCGNFVAGIGVDSSGTVWFNNSKYQRVGALNPTLGSVTWTTLLHPNPLPRDGLGIDNAGNIWYVDVNNHKLGKIPAAISPTPTATATTPTTTPTATATTPTTTPTITPTPPPIVSGPVNPTWYFAEGKVGQGFTEFLTIQNPDPVNTCSVSLQYLLSNSTPAPKAITIAPNTRFTESVNSDLLTPSSSTSYQAVSTIVTVTNTPTCKGVVAERPIYFTNFKGISSGTDVLGATHTGTDFYFADVSSLPGYNSYITILNPPGVTAATITATYSLGGNILGTDTLAVAPGTRGTIIPKSFGQRVATWVHSSAPVVVERPTYFNNYSTGNAHNAYGAASVVGAPAPANDWRFAEGYTGGQFQENLVLANFGTTAATGTLVLEYDNGSTLTNSITVPPQDVFTVDVNNTTINQVGTCAPMPCVLSQSVSAEITMSSGIIVAEREMFFHYSHFDRLTNRTVNAQGGTDVTGQSGAATATSYSFAEGYTNAGFDEWLTVQNPTANPETVWVTLVNGKSNTYQFSVVVGGHARATVNIVDVVVQFLFHLNDGVGGYEVSMTVQTTSGGVFVAERPMYWNYSGTQGGSDVIGYIGG